MLSLSRGFFLTIASLVFFTGPTAAQPYSRLNLDANRIQWNYLLYEVKSTSADVTTEVRLESPTPTEAQAALIETRQGDPVPVPIKVKCIGSGTVKTVSLEGMIRPVSVDVVKSACYHAL